MNDAKRILKIIFLAVLVLGLTYPFTMTGIARVTPSKADGNIIEVDGQVVGARNIGQEFSSPQYFHGRPSAGDYDAMASGAANLGPSSPHLVIEAQEGLDQILEENPGIRAADVPVEMVTSSGSGLDPEIGIKSALMQVARISEATGLSIESLRALIARYEQGRFLWIFGEPRVNVLELNLEVQKMLGEVQR